MKNLIWSLIALASMIGSHASAETYHYTGNNFTIAIGQYTTQMQVTGSITTSVPIPPNSIDFDIRTIMTSWTFSDGLQTITNENGVYHPSFSTKFSTDGTGNIFRGDVWVGDDPLGTVIGDKNNIIQTSFTGGIDAGMIQAACTEPVTNPCMTYAFGPDRGLLFGSPGTWTIEEPVRDFSDKLPSGTTGSISFATDDTGCTFDPLPQFLSVDSVSPAPPKEVAPIDGLVEFTIATCTPGATVTVSVDYGASLPADAEYWKVGDPWFKLNAKVLGSVIKFSITDGGFGDGDGIENGQIVDPGGASIADIFTDGFESQ